MCIRDRITLEDKTNNGLLYIKDRLQHKEAKRLLKLNDDNFTEVRLKLSPEITLFQIDQSFISINATISGIKEQALGEFCFIVLKSFKKEHKVKEVVEKVLRFYHVSQDKKEEVTKQVVEQVREAITYGLLSS